MRGRMLFIAGAAVGYVLGARAGRKRYEQIKAAASRVWETPTVQRQVHTAQDYAADKLAQVPGLVLEGARKIAANKATTDSSSQKSENERTTRSKALRAGGAEGTSPDSDDAPIVGPSPDM